MDLTTILIILCSVLGLICIIIFVVCSYYYCKSLKQEKTNDLNNKIGEKIVELEGKTKQDNYSKSLGQEHAEKEHLEKDLQENKSGRIVDNQSNLNQEINNNNGNNSSVNLLVKRNENNNKKGDEKMTANDKESVKIKDNYSFLEGLIRSKIQEIVLSEGESVTKREVENVKYSNDERKEIDVFRQTEYSKANDNSVNEKNKKDIEDHKDCSESDMSFRG